MSLEPGTIQATNIWKKFREDRRKRMTRDQLQALKHRIVKRQKPGWRYVLKDVEMIARPGEAIGLFGANGSGKSTLLKILTRVMYPSAGAVEVEGRVGALIEVRAGLHSELTGRENAFLYGSLLGLARKQVAERFDAIVDFAQLEDAIDRQIKFYSSGMQMRLGFAVAAFLEPDILLVDEILAVGDASFQQRCLDRMGTVLAQGTTLVFVSHDLASIEAITTRGMWLHQGVVQADGPVRDVLGLYRQAVEEGAEILSTVSGVLNLVKAEITPIETDMARTDGPIDVKLVFESPRQQPAVICVGFSEGPGTPIFLLRHDAPLAEGETVANIHIPRLPLPRGRFYLWLTVLDGKRQKQDLLPWHPVAHVDVGGPDLDAPPRGVVRLAPLYVPATWDVGRP